MNNLLDTTSNATKLSAEPPKSFYGISFKAVWIAVMLVGFFACFMFAAEGNMGIDLADEGFVWYGAQRILHQELPLRDYMAYDIARYFWAALFMMLSRNEGILVLRASFLALMPLSLFYLFASLNLRSKYWNWHMLTLLGISLCVYAEGFSTHLPDASIAIALLASISFLVHKPSRQTLLANGVVLGLAAEVGKNHGLYGLLASVLAIIYLASAQSIKLKDLLFWGFGIFLGLTPLLVLMIFSQKFTSAFFQAIHFILFELKDTNWPIPVPSCMSAFGNQNPLAYNLHLFLLGIGFIALPIFDVLGGLFLIFACRRKLKLNPSFVAAVLLSIPYTHYAFSRADVGHLVLGALPAVVGLFALFELCPLPKLGYAASTIFSIILIVFVFPYHPLGFQTFHPGWKAIDLGNERLVVTSEMAENISNRIGAVRDYTQPNEAFLAEPDMSGLYAALRAKSPTWEIYALFKRSESFQLAELERVKRANPKLVLWHDSAVDDIESRRFSASHPLLLNYILSNYYQVPPRFADPSLKLFVRKATQASSQCPRLTDRNSAQTISIASEREKNFRQ